MWASLAIQGIHCDDEIDVWPQTIFFSGFSWAGPSATKDSQVKTIAINQQRENILMASPLDKQTEWSRGR
jgi:hypothetical protein